MAKSSTPFKNVKEKKFLPEEIFQHTDKETHIFEDEVVKMKSSRYHLFKTKGCTCLNCGRVGTHFKLEQNGNIRYHFNLYSDDNVLMTKDHIIPKSRGGINHIDNYQTMCSKCNGKKSNAYTKEDAANGVVRDGFSINVNGAAKTKSTPKYNVSIEDGSNTKGIKLSLNQMRKLKTTIIDSKKVIRDYMIANKINCYEVKEKMPEEIQVAMKEVIEVYKKIIAAHNGKLSPSSKILIGLPASECIRLIEDFKNNSTNNDILS